MITRADSNHQVSPEALSHRGRDEGPHVSPSRLAEYWGVSVDTVYRDIRKGALPAFRVGSSGQFRIRLSDARRYGRPVE
jgi:excisionase family DNA binding protein